MTQPEDQRSATGGARRTKLGGALLVAALIELLILGGAVLVSVLTERTGELSWLVAPVVGVAVAMGKVLIGEAAKPQSQGVPPPATPPTTPPAFPPPQRRSAYHDRPPSPPARAPSAPVGQPSVPRRPRSGTPVPVAMLVVLLLLGGGGVAVALGVRYVTGYVTGNESGVERLVQPASVTDQELTLAVESVVQTSHFTRVGIAVTNGLGNTVSLPLFGNAFLSTTEGLTLEADPFRSNFGDTIPAGAVRRGTVVFVGHPPEGATTLSLSFATIFEQGFEGPQSLTVSDIALRPDAGTAAGAGWRSSTRSGPDAPPVAARRPGSWPSDATTPW